MLSKIKKFFKNLFEDETSKQIDAAIKEIEFNKAQLVKRADAWRDENREYLDTFGDFLKECEEWFKEQESLESSIERAREAGVPEEKIIHNYEEGEWFFMGD